jgi:hypothetical protein
MLVSPHGIQQPPILLHEAPHIVQVTTVGRRDDGLLVLLIHVCHRAC